MVTTEQYEENKVDMQYFDATTYRRSAARLNYLAQDRPDIAFAANFLARSMAHPRVGDEVRMKRVIRYIKAHPPLPLEFCLRGDAQAGDIVERQRLGRGSGHPPKHQWGDDGAHLLLFASRLQKTVALSSCEAELNAQVMGMSEGLGVSGVSEECELECVCDSSAARAVVGRMKHLEVRQLCRCQNSADVLTHPCSASQMQDHLCHAGVEVRSELDSSARGGGVGYVRLAGQ